MEGFVVPALACVHQSGLTVRGWSEPGCSLSSPPPLSLQSKVMHETCGGPGVGWGWRGLGGHDISQSTKPLPLSSEEHNRAK